MTSWHYLTNTSWADFSFKYFFLLPDTVLFLYWIPAAISTLHVLHETFLEFKSGGLNREGIQLWSIVWALAAIFVPVINIFSSLTWILSARWWRLFNWIFNLQIIPAGFISRCHRYWFNNEKK